MSNIIDLNWDGAEDDNSISYYELQWRTSLTSPWLGTDTSNVIQVPHIPNDGTNTLSKGGGKYSFIVTQLLDHYFQIRIVDNAGLFSDYKQIMVVVDKSTVLISKTGLNSLENVCILNDYTSEKQIMLVNSSGNTTTDIVTNLTFVKNPDNTSFNGSDLFWRILLPAESQGGFLPSIRGGISYSCQIDSDGKIISVTNCSSLATIKEGKRSYAAFNSISSNLVRPEICSTTTNTTMYYKDPMELNSIIYNNLEREIFNGNNLYYRIVADLNFYIVKINQFGVVSEIYSDFVICPIPTTSTTTTSCCFVKGSKISMFDNSDKNIEDVKVGDIVITYNEETKKLEPGEVTKTINVFRNDIIEYKLSNGVVIRSTSCHPYWVVNKGWSSFDKDLTENLYDFIVNKIEENDILLKIDNEEVIVEKITEVMVIKKVSTYNLQILGNHNYYANGILVHNKVVPAQYDASLNETQEWKIYSVTKQQCWSDYGASGTTRNNGENFSGGFIT